MKQLPSFLLSAVTAVAAIVVYDQVRHEEVARAPAPSADSALSDAVESIEARLARIEAARDIPPEIGADSRTIERLDERLKALEAVLEATPLSAESPAVDMDQSAPAPSPAAEPSPEDVESFRKLQAAARQQERAARNERLVRATLDKLSVALTDEQKVKLVEAYGAFEGRRNEIWGEAKSRGMQEGDAVNWDAIISETRGVIQREFTDRISSFIPLTYAAAISERLNPSGK